MATAATECRRNPVRLLRAAILACLIALGVGTGAAQVSDVTEAEMRYLRSEARTASATTSPADLTDAELRDLRIEARLQTGAHNGGPAFHGLSDEERADLRAAARFPPPLATTPEFSVSELSDLRAEARVVFPRRSGPIQELTDAEIRDLRKLAHEAQIAQQADRLTKTR